MASNPFKEAEERKRKEAEERKKREAEEAAKAEVGAATQPVVPKAEDIEPAAPALQQEAPVAPEIPMAPAAPAATTYENVANALREQIDAERGSLEKKVAVNVMIKPSLKRKMEQDVRNKKFKSMSYLITSLLEEYYK